MSIASIIGFLLFGAYVWWRFPYIMAKWDLYQGAKICAQHGHSWQRRFRIRPDLDPQSKYSVQEAIEFMDIVTEGKAAFCMRCGDPMPDKTRVEIDKMQRKNAR